MLINVKMLTEGVDVPDVKTVFLTRDTNSTILFTQMVGRALRGEKAGGKKDTANVVLFSDNWDRHVSFASSQAVGGKADSVATKERGYRPYELISVDILDNLQLEYENQNYDTTILDLVPIGWYVVSYTDTIIEEVEANDFQPTIESFKENVTILEQEESLFQNFIANFENNTIWEHEELDRENAAILMKTFLDDNGYTNDKVIVRKLIQIARHLGQNGFEPHFFTFEQREVLNLMPTVLEIRNKNYGRDDTEAYLEHKYGSSGNSFLKVAFPSYEDYYKAYEHEDNVYRKHKKGNVQIAEASQEIKVKRFAPNEVRKIVFARDEYQCVCCGKKDRLEIDHIIAFKEIEPTDDNPELYQTLCGICNKFKGVNAYNYRITKYDKNQMSLDIVPDDSTKWIKFAPFYFTRLINCYYKTDAVIKSSIIIKDDNRAIWVAKLKYGTNGESPNPDENIMQIKNEIIEMISNNRYRLSDIRIEMD